jgi:hypothetical protein
MDGFGVSLKIEKQLSKAGFAGQRSQEWPMLRYFLVLIQEVTLEG